MKPITTEYVKMYDTFYGYIAFKERYNPTENQKVTAIEQILSDMTWDMSNCLRAYVKYSSLDMAMKNTKIDKKKITRQVDLGTRWMYFPENIKIAIPGFYDVAGPKTGNPNLTILNAGDFDNCKYIVNSLKKSGIVSREQLYKHLSYGWYYLWTIPGCGDKARQKILKAIDSWEGRGNIFTIQK